MREPLVTHQMIRLNGSLDVMFVDANTHSHEHVLGSLCYLSVNLEKIRSLESLVPEVIIVKVSLEIDSTLQNFMVLFDYLIDILSYQGSIVAYKD